MCKPIIRKNLEIFKLIKKSKTYIDNPEDSKIKRRNIILRGFDDNEYFKYFTTIDETTDQYLIFITVRNELVKFLWNCWDIHNCSSEEFNKFGTATLPIIKLNEVIDEYLNQYK